ncbi:MAG: TerC family protein [Burkholderiaceae bacterium]
MEFWDAVGTALFWKALLQIIVINIILSGDNAVVIALAARHLPKRQQTKAIVFGSAAAIVLRVLLTVFAVQLLQYPYLKLAGAVLLVWIGAKLLLPDDDHEEADAKGAGGLFDAIRTILIADLVMSLDNVIGVAAAAETGPPQARFVLLLIGLGLSIPLIIVGSQVLLKMMVRWPIIITFGAALLGYVAGEMVVTDPAVAEWFHAQHPYIAYIVGFAGAALVVMIGRLWAARQSNTHQVDHA